MRNKKRKNSIFEIIALILILLNIGLIIYVFQYFSKPSITSTKPSLFTINVSILANKSQTKVFIPLLAVDNNGNGKIVKLFVEAKSGEGNTLVSIDNIFFWIDTQESIRIAKKVAEEVAKVNTSKIDIIYKIESDAQVVGGPSAGAAIAIATIAAITNKTLNPYVAITGTINEDGSIGQVGGILEKAKAAKDFGIKILLVPKGQSTYYEYKQEKECRRIASFEFCTIRYVPEEVNISKEVGIEVVEVSNIKEATKYFFYD
ncbi:MAG: S16 family serine protease [Candidatus Aenigmatarchaeota archaeon]